MSDIWKTQNPAVLMLNDQLQAAGHDLTKRKPGNAIYGKPHRQQLENLAFALIPVDPKKRARNEVRLFADHVFWLDQAGRLKESGWPARYETQENIATDLSVSNKVVKDATAELVAAGLLVTAKQCPPGKAVAVNHYRLSEDAHIILALLAEAGAMALPSDKWRELLTPSNVNAKPLRDVLAGWQGIDTPAKLEAMRGAIKAAVDVVQDDKLKVEPRGFYTAWRKAVKATTGLELGPYEGKTLGQAKNLLDKIKAIAAEPDAGFVFSKDMALGLAADIVPRWPEFVEEVTHAKGWKKGPAEPDLAYLATHVAHAIKVYLAPKTSGLSVKSGW